MNTMRISYTYWIK